MRARTPENIHKGVVVKANQTKDYEDEKIPMSVMIGHLLLCYKYGIKTLYYFNTYDGQGEVDISKLAQEQPLAVAFATLDDQENCESCTI